MVGQVLILSPDKPGGLSCPSASLFVTRTLGAQRVTGQSFTPRVASSTR